MFDFDIQQSIDATAYTLAAIALILAGVLWLLRKKR